MNHYMYSTAAEEIEAKRLIGLNQLHNPHTLHYLFPLLPGRTKILELGCGGGHLASELLAKVSDSVCYVGIDRDPAQVQQSKALLQCYPTAEILQLDIVSEIEKLNNKAPFDLIYCRWLLVHLPSAIRVEVIANLINLLSENGVFLVDECDNRHVRFKLINHTIFTDAPYEQATKLWSEISSGLMQLLQNDLELTPEKIKNDFENAIHHQGTVKIEGQYQVVLRGKDQKRLLTDGYRSSSAVISTICNDSFEKIIAVFDACVEDDNIEIEFLTQNVVTHCAKVR